MVASIADRIVHIHDGEIIACQNTKDFIENGSHIRSRKMISQVQQFREGSFNSAVSGAQILQVKQLGKSFKRGIMAFEDVSFLLHEGERLGIIGESGSGKSSLGKCISGIWNYDTGVIDYLVDKSKVTYVFQDAYSSMDPSLSVRNIINEVLRLKNTNVSADNLIEKVLLPESILNRKITELSGGQRQRVNLARAIATDPAILICDEITSGLDLIVQFEIIELLKSLKNVAIIFISHDVSLVKYFCQNLLIMRQGRVIAYGETKKIYQDSEPGYAFDLINSVPKVKYFLNM